MPIVDYFVNNVVMLFELVGLFIILFISAHISNRVKIYTRITVFLLLVSIIVTAFETWTQTFETLSLWRPILTAFKYSIYPLILISVIVMITGSFIKVPKKYLFLLCIPEIASIPLYLSSQWTRVVFFFTSDNKYFGGPLKHLPYIIFIIYLAIFVVINIVHLRFYSIRNRIIAMYICLASLACVVGYFIIDKTDDYNPIFTSSLVFYFLFMYIHMASIDPLTGLKIRQSYYQDLIEYKNKITYVASIDMNDLKLINDKQGHSAGDQALLTISTILKSNAGQKAACYRVGGDEFMLLFFDSNEKDVTDMIKNMRAEIISAGYSCAFGYAKNKPDKPIEKAIKESDKKMYEDKAAIKEERKNKTKITSVE